MRKMNRRTKLLIYTIVIAWLLAFAAYRIGLAVL